MKQINELLDTGLYETFSPERSMTIGDLLKELNLEGKFFGILVDGKKADPETKINEKSEVIILPHIAGG
ncbi:MAG: MoaD/ThiS family protein [Candidatus Hodarchaeota archaeon]